MAPLTGVSKPIPTYTLRVAAGARRHAHRFFDGDGEGVLPGCPRRLGQGERGLVMTWSKRYCCCYSCCRLEIEAPIGIVL